MSDKCVCGHSRDGHADCGHGPCRSNVHPKTPCRCRGYERNERDESEEMAAFIGHKGLGDEFHEWVLARRVEIDGLLGG